jgi:hypothetical protein
LDTCAADHTFISKDCFRLLSGKGAKTYKVYGGRFIQCKGRGTINIYGVGTDERPVNVVINNVQYCPGGGSNILKPQLLEQSGWNIDHFLDRDGYLIDPQCKKIKTRRNRFDQPVFDMILQEEDHFDYKELKDIKVRDELRTLREYMRDWDMRI